MLPERIESKITIDPTSGCWLWTACRQKDGYGRISYEGKTHYAHRLAYHLLVGEIPAGLHLDHLCRTRHCVNPEHLEPVTNRENSLRGLGPTATAIRRAAQRQCVHGHPLSGDNLVQSKLPLRVCRTCKLAQMREYDRRRRAKTEVA